MQDSSNFDTFAFNNRNLVRFIAHVSLSRTVYPSGRLGSRDPRGPVPPDQEGPVRAQAPRAQPQGQGLQVPPHSYREPRAPPGALLQADQEAAAQLEVVSATLE